MTARITSRITKISVTPDDCELFALEATHIEIEHAESFEYVTITQSTDAPHGNDVIEISKQDWPAIRSAINKLIKQCR